MRKQIIIDNDGGTDDYVAILYAFLSKKFDVRALTLVAGNTNVDNVQNNTFKALETAQVAPRNSRSIYSRKCKKDSYGRGKSRYSSRNKWIW